MNNSKNVSSLYDNYDNLITKCVPNYEMAMIKAADNLSDLEGNILDIGIGTGNLEKHIFKKSSNYHVIGLDTSLDFLNIASSKYLNNNLEIIVGDIRDFKFSNNYTNIISSLCIHHFENKQKQKIFSDIYKALRPGGCFINFDMVKPDSNKKLSLLKQKLYAFWANNNLNEEFIDQEKQEMRDRDRLVTLTMQKQWLEKLGFKFDLLYLEGLFCIYKCTK